MDLNNLKIPGVYSCGLVSIVNTLKNCPCNHAFKLIVEKISSNDTITSQKIVAGNFTQFSPYIRTYDSNNNWGQWEQLATNSNCLMHMQDFSGDFNSTTIPPGIYRIRTKDTYSHGPKSSPQYATFIQFFNYNIQYIIDGRTISMRKYVGSPAVWEPWYTISGTAES